MVSEIDLQLVEWAVLSDIENRCTDSNTGCEQGSEGSKTRHFGVIRGIDGLPGMKVRRSW